MTKYLDSKGLSYLWQKIKAELATKSDNHEHPYVKDTTVIKLGSTDTTGISLVKGTEGAKDSWTLPFATTDKTGVVRTGNAAFTEPAADSDWHKAPVLDGYVYYQNTLADTNTVTSSVDLTNNKVVLGAGSKGIKVSTYEIGKESYTAPATFGGANLLATEAAVKEYVEDVAGGVTTGLQLSYTDGTKDNDGKKVIKLTDTNNAALSFELDATPFIKDGMLKSVQILKYTSLSPEDATAQWVTLDGTEVTSEVKEAPSAEVGSIWMYFVWNTDASDTATVAWLPATELINDCSADGDRGLGTGTNDDGGHLYYVKTSEGGSLSVHNVSTGFDEKGNVVGYVDLSAYQKSAALVAFDKTDMDAIFAAAEADLTANKGVPTFPTADPLVKEEPAQPEA
jgi:hypothetical protein